MACFDQFIAIYGMSVVSYKSEDRTVKIGLSKMPINMQDYAIGVAKMAFDLYKGFIDIAEYIRGNFDERYGRCWHCVVGTDYWMAMWRDNGRYICLCVGDKQMTLWKRG